MNHEINRAMNDNKCRLLPGCQVTNGDVAPGVHVRESKWRGVIVAHLNKQ